MFDRSIWLGIAFHILFALTKYDFLYEDVLRVNSVTNLIPPVHAIYSLGNITVQRKSKQ